MYLYNLKVLLTCFLRIFSALDLSTLLPTINSVQSLSRVWFFVTPWTAARQASLSITNSWRLLKLMSIGSVMPSNHLIHCCLLLFLPFIFPSIRVFSDESVLCIRWPEYWSFNFSMSPSNKYSGLISFMDGLVTSPCSPGDSEESSPAPQYISYQHQHHRVSVLWHSAFFMLQLSHPYLTTGKIIALTR